MLFVVVENSVKVKGKGEILRPVYDKRMSLRKCSCLICSQLRGFIRKVFSQRRSCVHPPSHGLAWIGSCRCSSAVPEHSETSSSVGDDGGGEVKVKRKKLKGKRAVVRWVKFFRWKKKKEYGRMTGEEKILYKLRKARKKEERLVEALKKIKPKESSETTYDPEILEQDLELLQAQARRAGESNAGMIQDTKTNDNDKNGLSDMSNLHREENSSRVKEIMEQDEDCMDDDSDVELGVGSDSEDLSDIFETDPETECEDKTEDNLYLDVFDKFPAQNRDEPEDFDDHLRQISMDSRNARTSKHPNSPNLDEVDRMFLRAASLLKKRRR